MLRACVLDLNWYDHLVLVEFAYNNSYHSTIIMAPFEALYGRKSRSSICWDEIGEKELNDPELVLQTAEEVTLIRGE